MHNVVMRLLLKVFEQLFAELELFTDHVVFRSLHLPGLLRGVRVRKILRRRRMYLPLWPPGCVLAAADYRHRHGRLSRCLLGGRGRRRRRRWSCLLHDDRLNLGKAQKNTRKGTVRHTSSGGGICLICFSKTSSTRFPIRVIRWSAPLKIRQL